MDLLLYFVPGSCSRVAMIALEEVGLQFETRLASLMAGEHNSPEYRALNPGGKVPLLLVDGNPISQNLAILHFLAREFPSAGLLPATCDSFTDARVLSKIVWCSSDLHPLVTRFCFPALLCDLPAAGERMSAVAKDLLKMQLASAEDALSRNAWMLGENWSVVDAYIFWIWGRITGAGFPGDLFPNILDHSARMKERPAVQRALKREAEAKLEIRNRGQAMPTMNAENRL